MPLSLHDQVPANGLKREVGFSTSPDAAFNGVIVCHPQTIPADESNVLDMKLLLSVIVNQKNHW
jgi:hypothetical protein